MIKVNRSRALALMVLYLGLYVGILIGVYQTASPWVVGMGAFLIIMFETLSFIAAKTAGAMGAFLDYIEKQVALNQEGREILDLQHKQIEDLISVTHELRNQIEALKNGTG